MLRKRLRMMLRKRLRKRLNDYLFFLIFLKNHYSYCKKYKGFYGNNDEEIERCIILNENNTKI
jgi:hypothetical protein